MRSLDMGKFFPHKFGSRDAGTVAEARAGLGRDLGRVFVWLAAVALTVGFAKASFHAGLGSSMVARAVGLCLACFFTYKLSFAILAIGSEADSQKREGFNVHCLSHGAMGLLIVIAGGMALFFLSLVWERTSILACAFAIVGLIGCLYGVAATLLYRIVWNEEVIWARDYFLRWQRCRWSNLSVIELDSKSYTWRLKFAPAGRIHLSVFSNNLQAILDYAQDVLNKNQDQSGNA